MCKVHDDMQVHNYTDADCVLLKQKEKKEGQMRSWEFPPSLYMASALCSLLWDFYARSDFFLHILKKKRNKTRMENRKHRVLVLSAMLLAIHWAQADLSVVSNLKSYSLVLNLGLELPPSGKYPQLPFKALELPRVGFIGPQDKSAKLSQVMFRAFGEKSTVLGNELCSKFGIHDRKTPLLWL